MSRKKNSPSSTQDSNNSKTQIILAVIGLISTLGVAYLGYLQVVAKNNQPSATPLSNIIAFPTNTPGIISTETLAPTATPGNTATTEVLSSPTPQPLISFNCLYSEKWFYTPRLAEPTDQGCWKVDYFIPSENGVEMARTTPFDSGEQQRGFYTLLSGDVDVQFTIKIHALEEQTISTDLTKVSNIALGIVEGSSFNYNGIYLYYYASKPGAGHYKSQVAKEQSTSYNGILDIERQQKIRFLVKGSRLTIYIDDVPVGKSYTLTFKQNAFYFGYRLLGNSDLSVSVSNLSFTP